MCKIMMGTAIIFFLMHVIDYAVAVPFLPNMKPFHIDRFDGTSHGLNDVPIKASYTIVRQVKNVFYINSTITVTEDIEGDLVGISKVHRCRSKENLDTCELYLTTRPNKYCTTINPKLSPVPSFTFAYTPEYKCPIKKGIYNSYNNKVDLTVFLVIPLEDAYWKTVTEVRDPKTHRLMHSLNLDGYQTK